MKKICLGLLQTNNRKSGGKREKKLTFWHDNYDGGDTNCSRDVNDGIKIELSDWFTSLYRNNQGVVTIWVLATTLLSSGIHPPSDGSRRMWGGGGGRRFGPSHCAWQLPTTTNQPPQPPTAPTTTIPPPKPANHDQRCDTEMSIFITIRSQPPPPLKFVWDLIEKHMFFMSKKKYDFCVIKLTKNILKTQTET